MDDASSATEEELCADSKRDNTHSDNEMEGRFCFYMLLTGISKRYLVAFLTFLGFINVFAIRTSFSVTIVFMVTNRTGTINNIHVSEEFDWDPKLQVLGMGFYIVVASGEKQVWNDEDDHRENNMNEDFPLISDCQH